MYIVIMAGGRGTRFWPRSRDRKPKHLLDILSERTIIQETVDRLLPLVPPERILIVTGRTHAAELARQLPDIPAENILIEPMGRNTAPCIGLAAHFVRRLDPGAVMAVLPADHLITDGGRFLDVLRAAAEAAAPGHHLVTIGINPTAPETGYGYLELGEEEGTARGEKVWQVRSVREKPDRETAQAFLAEGCYVWNSGMFVWTAAAIIDAIGQWLPDLAGGLARIDTALGTDRENAVLEDVYPGLPSISVDYGVMEKADNVLVLRGDFGWSDVGSWDALWEVSPKDPSGNVLKGSVAVTGTRNSLVVARDRLVALAGVEDLIVVDTEDALLVCRRGDSQRVKELVDLLEKEGLTQYL
ncbi:MAG: mannose-1-phosphate guanylyltransferase [Deltaproteobacteria bacterium HGW-Deltaproteobacteria-19]|jgi:mannose-1-phosphate guanylyltransferase|nr:MAG: mannose-1-phosphate guanylyltransferase [Deltaproteobacteria bacterium HGW-Deltaproteobacteria-19]